MESYYSNKQRLKEEVIRLHSLWRKGPPPDPHPPLPTTYFAPPPPNPIPPRNPQNPAGISQQFTPQKQRKTNTKKRKMVEVSGIEDRKQKFANLEPASEETATVAVEKGSASGSEWPPFEVKADVERELTVDEKAMMSARQLHQKGIEACKAFFVENEGSDSDTDNEDSEDESLVGADGGVERDEFEFFKKLFEEDEGLKEYYLKSWGNGEFSCLVCRGNMEKVCKKFRNVVAVVQHSVTVSKTGRRRAHRAYGRVVCSLLNWDINQLPADAKVGDHVGDQGEVKLVGSGDVEKDLDLKWLREERPDSSKSGWGRLLDQRYAVPERELTEEEKVKVAATQVQYKSREAARLFFSQNVNEDSDDDSGEEVEGDGGGVNESRESDKWNECEEYNFLVKLFEEDEELNRYYAERWNNGAFFCLVCWGIVEKVNKRYKDCVALVRHCVSICNTKRRKAHRAYGKLICDLLNWDMNRLPANVLPVGNASGNISSVASAEKPDLGTKCGQEGSEQPVEPLTDRLNGSCAALVPAVASPAKNLQSTEPFNCLGDAMENGKSKDLGEQEALSS